MPYRRASQISKHCGLLSSTCSLQSARQRARTIPLPLLLYLTSESNSPHCRSNQIWSPESSDFSFTLKLLICCLLTSVPWFCDWHVVEPGLQGLPQPLTKVAFLATLLLPSSRLLTLGGGPFQTPLPCPHCSRSSYLGNRAS